MVKNRLAQPDAQTKGWLLDGYPRSESQGRALEAAGIHPELFILLEVCYCRRPRWPPLLTIASARRCLTMCWWSA
jgi:Adenylate kinase